MEAIKYNNYSRKLLEHFPKATEKSPLRFQILGIRVDTITQKAIIPATLSIEDAYDRIFDPWAKEIGVDEHGVMQYEGDYIDIANIIAERPAPVGSARQTDVEIGPIQFVREMVGAIEDNGRTRAMEQKMRYLFFSNANLSNSMKFDDEGKQIFKADGTPEMQPWHIPPRFGYKYELVSRSVKAKNTLAEAKLIDKANQAINEFTPKELDKYKRGLFPNSHQLMEDEELILALRSIAAKDPGKIIGLSKSMDVAMNAAIIDFEQEGLIEYRDENRWVWPETGKTICPLITGQTKYGCLKYFFTTKEGVNTLELLEGLLKSARAGKKKPAIK